MAYWWSWIFVHPQKQLTVNYYATNNKYILVITQVITTLPIMISPQSTVSEWLLWSQLNNASGCNNPNRILSHLIPAVWTCTLCWACVYCGTPWLRLHCGLWAVRMACVFSSTEHCANASVWCLVSPACRSPSGVQSSACRLSSSMAWWCALRSTGSRLWSWPCV